MESLFLDTPSQRPTVQRVGWDIVNCRDTKEEQAVRCIMTAVGHFRVNRFRASPGNGNRGHLKYSVWPDYTPREAKQEGTGNSARLPRR